MFAKGMEYNQDQLFIACRRKVFHEENRTGPWGLWGPVKMQKPAYSDTVQGNAGCNSPQGFE